MMPRRGFWSGWVIRYTDVKERKVEGISKKIHDYKKLSEELGVGEMTLQRYCQGAGEAGARPERGHAKADSAQRCAWR